MAAVATVQKSVSLGDTEKLYWGTIAFDDAYPTGGEAIDLDGNEHIDTLIIGGYKGYTFEFDQAAQKLKVFRGDNDNAGDAPGVEMANTGDLSALTAAPFIAVGA